MDALGGAESADAVPESASPPEGAVAPAPMAGASFEEFDRMLSQKMGLDVEPRSADAFDLEFEHAQAELADRGRQLDAELAGGSQRPTAAGADGGGADGGSSARRSVFQRKKRTSPTADDAAQAPGLGAAPPPAAALAQTADVANGDTAAASQDPPKAKAKKPNAVAKPRRIKKDASAPGNQAAVGNQAVEVDPSPQLEASESKAGLSPQKIESSPQSSRPVLTESEDEDEDSPAAFLRSRQRAIADAEPEPEPEQRSVARVTSDETDEEPLFTDAITAVVSTTQQQQLADAQQQRRQSGKPWINPQQDAVLLVSLVQCAGLAFPPCKDELEDVYVTLQFGTQPTERSSTKFLMTEPKYNETFRFLITADVTVGAEALLTVDVRGQSSSGEDLSIGRAVLDLCEVFATSGEEGADWAGQSVQRDWRVSRAVDADSSLPTGQVTIGLKAVSIGAPPVRPVISLPEATTVRDEPPLPQGWETAVSTSTGETYYANMETGETTYDRPPNPEASDASQEDLADLQSLANAFEASTLDLSGAVATGAPDDAPKPTPRSVSRVRIDESFNKVDTPKSVRADASPPNRPTAQTGTSRSTSRGATATAAQSGDVYARLGSPTRQAWLGSPPRGKGAKGSSSAAFKAGGKAALLAANSKFLAAPVSPRKQGVRKVDATAVGDRLSSHRPKRHGEEAAHVLAGEHSAQWATRLGSPTREQRLQSPNRRPGVSQQGDGDNADGSSATLDLDKLRQELRELKLMALHERATRTTVSDDAIDRALEGDTPKGEDTTNPNRGTAR